MISILILSLLPVALQATQLWESQDSSLSDIIFVANGENVSVQGNDISGDGIDDLFFRNSGSYGVLSASSGANGQHLWAQDFSTLSDEAFPYTDCGSYIYKVEDLDNDGYADLLIDLKILRWGRFANLLVAVSSKGGTILWEYTYDLDAEVGGSKICFQDMNSDGFEDVFMITEGKFSCINVRNGRGVWQIWGDDPHYSNYFIPSSLDSINDVDGDGLGDFTISQYDYSSTLDTNILYAVSSATGAYLWSRDIGLGQSFVTSSIDVNGDSYNDVIYSNNESSNGLNHNGGLTAYSGVDGNPCMSAYGIEDDEGWSFGPGFDKIGDLNQDGIEDMVFVKYNGVKAYSGANGNALWSFVAPNSIPGNISWSGEAHRLYAEELSPFDINADGVNDLIFNDDYGSSGSLVENGSIFTISGVDGTVLWSVFGAINLAYLAARDIVSDVNGDGYPDIAASELVNHTQLYTDGNILCLSGADGSEVLPQHFLGRVLDNSTFEYMLVQSVGDITGDGIEEFGTQMVDFLGQSSASSTKTYSYGMPLTANHDQISSSNGGNINYEINLGPIANFYEYRMLMSFAQGITPIGRCTVSLGFDLWLVKTYLGQWPSVFQNTSGLLDGEGKAVVQLSTSQIPASLIGNTIYFAAIARMPWDDWSRASNTVELEVIQ